MKTNRSIVDSMKVHHSFTEKQNSNIDSAILNNFSDSEIIVCNGVIFLLIKFWLYLCWKFAKIMWFVHSFSFRSRSLQKSLSRLTKFAWEYYCLQILCRRPWRHLVIKKASLQLVTPLYKFVFTWNVRENKLLVLFRGLQSWMYRGVRGVLTQVILIFLCSKQMCDVIVWIFQTRIISNPNFRPRWLRRINGRAKTRRRSSRLVFRCQIAVRWRKIVCKCVSGIEVSEHNLNIVAYVLTSVPFCRKVGRTRKKKRKMRKKRK